MGRQSRKHREKRTGCGENPRNKRVRLLEEELKQLMDGDAVFWTSKDCPPELVETNLEDIIAFESVGTGTSLFDGLQEHGLDLPHPDKLDERQCEDKIKQIVQALLDLRILLIGFEEMSAREFYSTLWNQTLWEGCYMKKRNPGAMTVIDVSHSIPRSEMLKWLEEAAKGNTIQ